MFINSHKTVKLSKNSEKTQHKVDTIMDRSGQDTSNSSPGFIYFNTNLNQEYQNKSDTTDFLAFGDSSQVSPQLSRFKPSYYSSPQPKYQRNSPRNYPQNNRKFKRWSGGNRSFPSSTNSSYSQNSSWRDSEQDSNISKFMHSSFLEDPWARLETKLKEQKQQEETQPDDKEET